MAVANDQTLLNWLRTDLEAAIEWHGGLAQGQTDPGSKSHQEGKAAMAATMLKRLDAYEAGEPPIQPQSRKHLLPAGA